MTTVLSQIWPPCCLKMTTVLSQIWPCCCLKMRTVLSQIWSCCCLKMATVLSPNHNPDWRFSPRFSLWSDRIVAGPIGPKREPHRESLLQVQAAWVALLVQRRWSFWDNMVAILGQHGCHFGTAWLPYWDNKVAILGQQGFHIGTT